MTMHAAGGSGADRLLAPLTQVWPLPGILSRLGWYAAI